MNSRLILALSLLIAALYGSVLWFGLSGPHLATWWTQPTAPAGTMPWHAPATESIPTDAQGELIREGRRIFIATPQFAADHARSLVSCSDCHMGEGIRPYAAPMVGLPAIFPTYNKRAGRVISLSERIQECFVRSENGTPLDPQGREMHALLAYIDWLSTPQPTRRKFIGRGLVNLPVLTPNPARGQRLYAFQCAGCHGTTGAGYTPQFPPLWGPDAFNDGAGMNQIPKMAAFIQHNMPQNRPGTLNAQDAWDLADYIHSQPHPAFNPAYQHY
jgi:thiosulfate dehydrogenase